MILKIIGSLMILSVFGVIFMSTVREEGLMDALKLWGLAILITSFICIGALLLTI